jgi:hypothetical protein
MDPVCKSIAADVRQATGDDIAERRSDALYDHHGGEANVEPSGTGRNAFRSDRDCDDD